MRQSSPSPTETKDYSGIFLVAILLGIVVVVFGLTMAAAHPAPLSDLAEYHQLDR